MLTTTLERVRPQIREFVTTTRLMLIDGKWTEAKSGKTIPVFDPSTGETMAQVAAGDKEDIDLAVKAARRAFESGPWR
ncbi:MAG: aldehyde dehydrogenase family protein, partial [Verrucomicrobia bacterium]|nr:aldehyde dehydrogenase family protein [Verrucomicrobiota bacterium]